MLALRKTRDGPTIHWALAPAEPGPNPMASQSSQASQARQAVAHSKSAAGLAGDGRSSCTTTSASWQIHTFPASPSTLPFSPLGLHPFPFCSTALLPPPPPTLYPSNPHFLPPPPSSSSTSFLYSCSLPPHLQTGDFRSPSPAGFSTRAQLRPPISWAHPNSTRADRKILTTAGRASRVTLRLTFFETTLDLRFRRQALALRVSALYPPLFLIFG
ncbi:uncharacterized protein N7482_001785 [Penicillium canariense]|uniref:Uncharacterized protein n=1 Tax=Penicillium canariense TaxID=189055 RepID=A0A9W9LT97_9EURO|nr:uncharacterized protein N7482_001785 [Penicillium canariense]KAJ5175908.1 hypothetical protein N7482_001785 [Penicillium canariense]